MAVVGHQGGELKGGAKMVQIVVLEMFMAVMAVLVTTDGMVSML